MPSQELSAPRPSHTILGDSSLLRRIQGEFLEMPCLRLTEAQAQRFLGVDQPTCSAVITTLIEQKFLRRTPSGVLMRADDAAPTARRLMWTRPGALA